MNDLQLQETMQMKFKWINLVLANLMFCGLAMSQDKFSEIMNIGYVLSFLWSSGQSDMNSRGEVVENFMPSRVFTC